MTKRRTHSRVSFIATSKLRPDERRSWCSRPQSTNNRSIYATSRSASRYEMITRLPPIRIVQKFQACDHPVLAKPTITSVRWILGEPAKIQKPRLAVARLMRKTTAITTPIQPTAQIPISRPRPSNSGRLTSPTTAR